jgi:hypothetical protein
LAGVSGGSGSRRESSTHLVLGRKLLTASREVFRSWKPSSSRARSRGPASMGRRPPQVARSVTACLAVAWSLAMNRSRGAPPACPAMRVPAKVVLNALTTRASGAAAAICSGRMCLGPRRVSRRWRRGPGWRCRRVSCWTVRPRTAPRSAWLPGRAGRERRCRLRRCRLRLPPRHRRLRRFPAGRRRTGPSCRGRGR